jgi:hypothetical protein
LGGRYEGEGSLSPTREKAPRFPLGLLGDRKAAAAPVYATVIFDALVRLNVLTPLLALHSDVKVLCD